MGERPLPPWRARPVGGAPAPPDMTNTDHDSDVEVYRTEYDLEDDDSLCYAIVRAVGAVTNEEPTAAEPLYGSVDPDALQSFVRSLRNSHGTVERGFVEFVFSGCLVRVRADGLLELRHPFGGEH